MEKMETTTRLSNLRRDLINTYNISKDMQMEFIHLDNDIRILQAKLKNIGDIGDVSELIMIPKEKAKELYEKAYDFIYTSNAHFAEDDAAKNCAMMVVDEILMIVSIDFNEDYWENVKTELNSL